MKNLYDNHYNRAFTLWKDEQKAFRRAEKWTLYTAAVLAGACIVMAVLGVK